MRVEATEAHEGVDEVDRILADMSRMIRRGVLWHSMSVLALVLAVVAAAKILE